MAELLLKEIREETKDVKSFIFDKPEGFTHKAGQFLTVQLDVDDPKGKFRQFTIASSPSEDYIMITTTMRGGPFKNKLIESQGQKIKMRGPFGNFTLQEGKHVMLAGGIGITPFRSMIKFATDAQRADEITLLYSNKTPEDIAFKEELLLMEQMNEHLDVIHTITRPTGQMWQGLTGRIDANMIKEHVDLDGIFYICGPPKMVEGTQKLLKEMGVPDERVKFESFGGY